MRFYCRYFLKVLDKGANLVPLVFNSAQNILHDAIEAQLASKLMVRVKVVKARQQGISTYFQARARWRMKYRSGIKVYTVSHEAASTANLIKMAKRFQDNEPVWDMPSLKASNSNIVHLGALDSQLEIVTAGSREVGRSGTAQFLHASEAAYWEDPTSTWAALGQVLPRLPGTESWVESTGNGPNDYAQRIREDQAGKTDYMVVFIPWFVQEEYRIPVEAGAFEIDTSEENDEQALIDLYGLCVEQLAWRRLKCVSDFKGDWYRFAKEYPSTIEEAFAQPGKNGYLPTKHVLRAQKANYVPTGKLLIGADPATSDDGDTFGLVFRRGRKVIGFKQLEGKTGMQIAGLLAGLIDKYRDNPGCRVFLDVTGMGIIIYDRLVELGYADDVEPVTFSEAAVDDRAYANRRAEMAGAAKEWYAQGCQVPDDPVFLAHMVATSRRHDTSDGKLLLQRKPVIKKECGFSPDLFDALICSFASPTALNRQGRGTVDDGTGHGWLKDMM